MTRLLPRLVVACVLLLIATSTAFAQSSASTTASSGPRLGVRFLGGLATKNPFSGFQAGGEVYRRSADEQSLEIAIGLFAGHMTRSLSAVLCPIGAGSCGRTDDFVEGTGLMLFNFEPGKRVRPFAGGGITVGNHRDRFRYFNIAVAGGLNIDMQSGRAIRIDARLAQNLALMIGYAF